MAVSVGKLLSLAHFAVAWKGVLSVNHYKAKLWFESTCEQCGANLLLPYYQGEKVQLSCTPSLLRRFQ